MLGALRLRVPSLTMAACHLEISVCPQSPAAVFQTLDRGRMDHRHDLETPVHLAEDDVGTGLHPPEETSDLRLPSEDRSRTPVVADAQENHDQTPNTYPAQLSHSTDLC